MSRDAAERERLDSLFNEHGVRVLRYALRRAASAPDAEDAVSQTFLVAWRRLDSVPLGDEALPWLLAVCRRAISNQRRMTERGLRLTERLRRLVPRPPAMEPGDGPAVSALSALKDEDQELMRLVAWDHLSYDQIAAMIGISANAVAVRVHRARERFRVAFERACKDSALSGHSSTEAPTQTPSGENRP